MTKHCFKKNHKIPHNFISKALSKKIHNIIKMTKMQVDFLEDTL